MILVKPHLTEKSHAQTALNRYAFIVDPDANKYQIKDAVEALFKVNVTGVRTRRQKPIRHRSFRTGLHVTQKPLRKIAYVQLKDKQSIDLFKTK